MTAVIFDKITQLHLTLTGALVTIKWLDLTKKCIEVKFTILSLQGIAWTYSML